MFEYDGDVIFLNTTVAKAATDAYQNVDAETVPSMQVGPLTVVQTAKNVEALSGGE